MKLAMNRALGFSALALVASVLGPALVGCSATDPDLGTGEKAETPAAKTTSKLDVLDTLCSIANAVPSFDVGAFHLDDPTCHTDAPNRFYYLGSDGPNNYAEVLQDATYCTIATGTGSDFTGNAVFSSVVGGFGAKSEVRSFARDNDNRHIETEHVGKVVVFGVEVPLQYSASAWDFPREHQWSRKLPATRDTVNVIRNSNGTYRVGSHTYTAYKQLVPNHNGRYALSSNQRLNDWSIGGSGTIPIGVLPLHIEVKLKSNETYNNLENARFDNGLHTNPTYQSVLEKRAVCVANCNSVGADPFCALGCPMLSTDAVNGHELDCTGGGCNNNFWQNLTDGILPYSGNSGGASANLLYGDPTVNYWQLGYPGSRGNDGEPQFSLLNDPSKTSTEFDFLTEGKYSLGIATLRFGVKLDFDTRAGLSLRSRILPAEVDSDVVQRGDTELRADAETAINLSAFLNLHVGLPWPLSPIDFYLDYDLIDKKGNGHKVGTASQGGGYTWDDHRDGTSDAGTASCTESAPPGTDGPNPPSTSGWDFVSDAAKASVVQFHPCNVQICVPPDGNSTTGLLTTYQWNPTTLQLDEVPTGFSCNICQSNASMCDVNGNTVKTITANISPNCGGTGDACGGGQVCDANDDCDTGNLCIGGCCSTSPK